MSQDSVGSEDIEEVGEVGNSDAKVGAGLDIKLILHHAAAPESRAKVSIMNIGGFQYVTCRW